MIRKRLVKKHIVKDAIKRDCGNRKIIAYADLENRKFRSLLKSISPVEVRSLNDYNDNNYLYTSRLRWNGELVAMCATNGDEFHLWLGGAI